MKKKVRKKKTTPISQSKKKSLNKVGKPPQTKKNSNESTISKKDFRENPTVEKFYKTIHEYKLREDAYKTAIEIHLNHLLKETTQK